MFAGLLMFVPPGDQPPRLFAVTAPARLKDNSNADNKKPSTILFYIFLANFLFIFSFFAESAGGYFCRARESGHPEPATVKPFALMREGWVGGDPRLKVVARRRAISIEFSPP
jgi:hypothetical protein